VELRLQYIQLQAGQSLNLIEPAQVFREDGALPECSYVFLVTDMMLPSIIGSPVLELRMNDTGKRVCEFSYAMLVRRSIEAGS